MLRFSPRASDRPTTLPRDGSTQLRRVDSGTAARSPRAGSAGATRRRPPPISLQTPPRADGHMSPRATTPTPTSARRVRSMSPRCGTSKGRRGLIDPGVMLPQTPVVQVRDEWERVDRQTPAWRGDSDLSQGGAVRHAQDREFRKTMVVPRREGAGCRNVSIRRVRTAHRDADAERLKMIDEEWTAAAQINREYEYRTRPVHTLPKERCFDPRTNSAMRKTAASYGWIVEPAKRETRRPKPTFHAGGKVDNTLAKHYAALSQGGVESPRTPTSSRRAGSRGGSARGGGESVLRTANGSATPSTYERPHVTFVSQTPPEVTPTKSRSRLTELLGSGTPESHPAPGSPVSHVSHADSSAASHLGASGRGSNAFSEVSGQTDQLY